MRAVQLDKHKALLGIIISNTRVRELCWIENAVNKNVLLWLHYTEKIKNNKILKRVHGGKCMGSCSESRPQKKLDLIHRKRVRCKQIIA